MLFSLFVGIGVSLVNIAIHGLLTAAMVHAIGARVTFNFHANASVRVIVILVIAAAMLMTAHLVEIWIWGALYHVLAVTPSNVNEFSFAFVNYTTLGYGNVVPQTPWEVLGPMTAMNGVLLFGWSTAVLFQVLSVTSKQLHARR